MVKNYHYVGLWVGAAGLLVGVGVACSRTADKAPETSLVMGLVADPAAALSEVHYTINVEGAAGVDRTIAATELPKEEKLVAPPNASAKVDVHVEAFSTRTRPGAPAITRLVSTSFVPGQQRLLRVELDSRCMTGFPNGLDGPTCASPQTCIAGRCQDDAVAPQDLETYAPSWATNPPDACKPDHGAPEVIVGTGQTDYAPAADGQTVQAELGPQGGHHIWIALRMKNLKQTGSTTTVTAVQPSTGLLAPSAAFVFTFELDEGGFCKLYGLRYQLDGSDLRTEYKRYLGQPLDVTVEVVDRDGARASGVAHLNVAPLLLCPAAVPDCNG
jgi:hypothetical protein